MQYTGNSRDNPEYKGFLIGFLIHDQFIFFYEKLLETFILPINITMPKNSLVENLDSSIYNSQSFVSTCDIIYVGSVRFFYFNEDGKIYLHVIVKRR